jgi:hypothetical protein
LAKESKRLRRQFDALARGIPATRRPIRELLEGRLRLLRLPVAGLLISGGLFSFLPVLGIWMLPLGLMLLAVDVPVLRPVLSAAVIRARRRLAVLRRGALGRARRASG